MAAVLEGEASPLDGPISPELVLVCPELRARALAELPDPEWVSTIAQVRARAKVARPLPRRRRPRLSNLVWRGEKTLRVSLTFFARTALLTLALTLIADVLR